ncbi:MAG: Preprotein translocase, SecE subunit [Parcubacteria group bacterium GW2011_GWC1_45_9]|nr:MAG: Preprotein translocase, SecE subunit [Parcubacteria group bacterium GW2011_GWA1_Parcubacteria_45_10]KKT89173.1 MAG: Preprotein translocase, SecE subunit [Parcubacteria group bacterium GW2011_GWB1_45_10]KKU17368.1 MAG: Preprotein translocase, SecE subunit [Parcubacteria group bacterium GW2011_GWC1_45_9]HCI05711.1 preprotein translocase subunit SecE [Patescibacteria group bacterium]
MKIIEFLKNYLKETKVEIQKVSWPTRQETLRYLVIIIVFSGVMAIFLGLFDFAFLQVVERIIIR